MPHDMDKRLEVLSKLKEVHQELIDISKDAANLEVRESKAAKERVVATFERVKIKLDEISKNL